MPNDKFCVRPFMHSLVDTEGRFNPCCRSFVNTGYNIKTHTVREWWNSDYMNDFRGRIIRGEYSPECKRCYQQEQVGAKSFREYSNEEWPEIGTEALDYPVDWEIQFSNLCNLKCLMCNPQSSSRVLVEENKLFFSKWEQKKYDWDPKDHDKIVEIINHGTSFVLRGGEPFMLPWFKDILKEVTGRKEFMIATNGTKFDKSWLKLLSNHDIKMCLSIDGYRELNHYIRYPSRWNTILKNIKLMKQIPNVNLFINTVVQNLNILHLDQLLDWAGSEDLFVQFDVLTKPKYLSPACLPEELALVAKERLSKYSGNTNQNGIEGILNLLENTNIDDWDQFLKMIRIKDRHRGINIVNYIPEMEPYFA